MYYFFALGNHPALSIAEIEAVTFPKKTELLNEQVLFTDLPSEINPQRLIKQLGGTIKIGRILKIIDLNKQKDLKEACQEIVGQKELELRVSNVKQGLNAQAKFSFGFSNYTKFNLQEKVLGMELKKYLRNKDTSSRLVVSKDKVLSSVIVEQNKLLRRGIELVIINNDTSLFVAETLAVQDFKSLSKRDYGRPARDDFSGMIPPKLAQMMINLAQIEDKNSTLLDPFCGSGTILSEAILLGHKNIIGTDLSFKAIQDTKKNISWLKDLYDLDSIKMRFAVKNVIDINRIIKNNSVDSIITEPYLGPQRAHHHQKEVLKELNDLYTQALYSLVKVLKIGGRLIMVWPVFQGKFIEPQINKSWRRLEVLPQRYLDLKKVQSDLNFRNNIIYGRAGQKVYREIIALEKIK